MSLRYYSTFGKPLKKPLIKSYINLEITFEQFLEVAELHSITELSIYWHKDEEYHETTSTRAVHKDDVLRFIRANACEIVSIRFVCNNAFEIESNGRMETVVSILDKAAFSQEEMMSDRMQQDQLPLENGNSSRALEESLLHTRKVGRN